MEGKTMNLWATLLIVLSLSLFNPSAWASGAHGVFRVVKGQVQVKSAQSGKVSRARIGSKVLPGDVIRAGKDSRAKVVMVDNNEINISPDTQIKIEKYEFDPGNNKKDVLLNVIYGKVRSKVEQKYDGRTSKFQVKTPSAVAGVRGTNFLTSYSAETGASQVVTFEGSVEFGKPGPGGQIIDSVQVTPGTMAEVGKGGAPPVQKPVPESEMKKMDKETNAETGSSSSSSDSGSKTESSGDKKSEDKKEPAKKDESAGKEDSGKKDGSSNKDSSGKKDGAPAKGDSGDKNNSGDKKSDSANSGKQPADKTPGKSDGKSTGNQADSSGKGGASNSGGKAGPSDSGGKAGPGGAGGKVATGPNGAGKDSGGSNQRGPSSVGPASGPAGAGPRPGGGSMIGDSDLAGGPGNQDFGQGGAPKMPGPIFDAPIAPPMDVTGPREIVEDATPATLKIIINQQ